MQRAPRPFSARRLKTKSRKTTRTPLWKVQSRARLRPSRRFSAKSQLEKTKRRSGQRPCRSRATAAFSPVRRTRICVKLPISSIHSIQTHVAVSLRNRLQFCVRNLTHPTVARLHHSKPRVPRWRDGSGLESHQFRVRSSGWRLHLLRMPHRVVSCQHGRHSGSHLRTVPQQKLDNDPSSSRSRSVRTLDS